MKVFNSIENIWCYLDSFKTEEKMKQAFENIPSKFGDFDIVNKGLCEEEKVIEICNSYWDNTINGYEYDYHCVNID